MNELRPDQGSTRNSKRRGRGIGSGNGKTAGRGHKGAGSRSGTKKKLYFEGGQTPLTRRVPKRGFKSPFKKVFQIVNISDIAAKDPADKEVNAEWLFDNGLIHSKSDPIKVLGDGDCAKSIVVKAQAFSKSAREKIEKAKGKAEVVASV